MKDSKQPPDSLERAAGCVMPVPGIGIAPHVMFAAVIFNDVPDDVVQFRNF